MKKFMMTLVALLALQAASMHGAWSAAKAFMSNPGVQNAFGTSVVTLPVYFELEKLTKGLNGVTEKASTIFHSDRVQQALGIYEPTTWYSKVFQCMNMADATVGTVLRWCGYAAALYQMANAVSSLSQNDANQQQQTVQLQQQSPQQSSGTSRRLTQQEREFLQKIYNEKINNGR